MIWHNVQQNTDEWFGLRAGKVGGSSIGTIMANYGKDFGEPAKKLAVSVAVEQLTGTRQEQSYSNQHMERGHEQEPIARTLYEQETFSTVTNGGFIECSDLVGISPDGLVDDDGIVEIKSVVAHVQYSTIKRGSFDPAYKWQLFYNLQHSERDWIDYVSFCAEFPQGKRLFIYRIVRADCKEVFEMMNDRMQQFAELVQSIKNDIQAI